MCVCDTGFSGDGFNFTGIQLIILLIERYDTVYLHIKNEEKGILSADNSSILPKQEKIFMRLYPYKLDMDECLTDPCHGNATCNNRVGSYLCTCNPRYSGDGSNCTGMDIIIVSLI